MMKWFVLLAVWGPLAAFAQETDVNDAYFQMGDFEVYEIDSRSLPAPNLKAPVAAMGATRSAGLLGVTAVTGGGIGSGTCVIEETKPNTAVKPKTSLVRTSKIGTIGKTMQKFADAATEESDEEGDEAGDSLTKEINPLDALDATVDKVINIGKKIWKVIDAGKPVVNLANDVATALPVSKSGRPLCWTQLEGWQAPLSQSYRAIVKNLYGMEVVRFDYRVLFVAGGSYKGKGHYIGYATVQPIAVDVAWGYNLEASASAPVTFNMGTVSNPVAGMNLEINYKAKTVFREIAKSRTFFITGKGDVQEIQ